MLFLSGQARVLRFLHRRTAGVARCAQRLPVRSGRGAHRFGFCLYGLPRHAGMRWPRSHKSMLNARYGVPA